MENWYNWPIETNELIKCSNDSKKAKKLYLSKLEENQKLKKTWFSWLY